MTEPEAPELTIEKLVGVYRVLIPHKHRGVHVPPQQHAHDHRRADDPLAQVHPAGRVRGLARRRDADPVAASRPPKRSSGPRGHQAKLEKLHAGGRRHRRPRHPSACSPQNPWRQQRHEEVHSPSRSSPATSASCASRCASASPTRGPRPTNTDGKRNNNRLVPDAPRRARRRPRADARHLRRRDPGARRRRPHVLRLRRPATATTRRRSR